MGEDGLLLASLTAGIIGGAIVAGRNDQPAWKGALAVVAGIAVALLATTLFPEAPAPLFLIVNVVGVAIAGSAMKLPPRLVVGVVLISALFQFLVGLLAGAF